jgi:hypothetical protein
MIDLLNLIAEDYINLYNTIQFLNEVKQKIENYENNIEKI